MSRSISVIPRREARRPLSCLEGEGGQSTVEAAVLLPSVLLQEA